MNTDTLQNDWRVALSTNSTEANFASIVDTTTEPVTGTNHAVIPLAVSDNFLVVRPFGEDDADETGKFRVFGWTNNGSLWSPVLLAEVTFTLSTAVGVAGQHPDADDHIADTLAVGTGPSTGYDVVSPTGNVPGYFTVDCRGFKKVSLTFDRDSSAAACNALYKTF
jgi:hypothetical protein